MEYAGADCMCTFTKNQVARGIASLKTNRMNLLNNYVPKPQLTGFENTIIRPTFTKGRIILQFPEYSGRVEIRIYDMLGRIIYRASTYQPFIDIRLDSPDGTYLIDLIKDGNTVLQKKIMINSGSPYGASFIFK